MTLPYSTETYANMDLIVERGTFRKTILYVGIRYDYGHPEWGMSYEHYNFYMTFVEMGYTVVYFDYDRLMNNYPAEQVSDMLLEACYYYHPDVVFYFNFHDWIKHDVWSEIKRIGIKTVIWLGDDGWRYDETKPIWERFETIITTDKQRHEQRQAEGFNSVLSQWGYNHKLYRKLPIEKVYDVTFIGRCHSNRKEVVYAVKEAGINITAFGQEWGNDDSARVSQAELIKLYNMSKIVLNISGNSKDQKLQIKGRDFEVPGCGSLLLTESSEQITDYFTPGKDCVVYDGIEDLIKSIKYLMLDRIMLDSISNRGYAKAQNEHTYFKRFTDLQEYL